MNRVITYIIFFICGIAFAQNPVEMVVDTTNIRIGEQIEYKISVDKQENVRFPKLVLDSLGKVEVVEALKIDTTETKYIKKYLLTSFDSGRYVIPRQQVFINTKKYLTDSLLIDVATVKVDTTKQNLYEIKAIKNQPIVFDDYKNYLWITLIILALILLYYYFIFRKKKEKITFEERIPPYELAMQRLSTLDGKMLWQKDRVKQYYVELTDIIRTYIEKELHIPALESTTDELIETITDFSKISTLDLPKKTIKDLQKLLREADLVKFAKFKPMSNEIESHRIDSENLINDLKPEEVEIIESSDVVLPEMPLETPQNKNSFNKKKAIKTAITVAIMVLSVNFGSRLIKYFNQQGNTISTEQLLEGEWNTKTYGYPSITFESPIILKKEELQLPENLKNIVAEMSSFNYVNLNAGLQIYVATTNYIEDLIDFNYEGLKEGLIQDLKTNNGIEVSTVKEEIIYVRNVKGIKIVFDYTEKSNITQEFEDYQIVMVAFLGNKGIKTVIVYYKKDDAYGKQIAERIVNSIDIEDEVVE